jgi:hypothetical protein
LSNNRRKGEKKEERIMGMVSANLNNEPKQEESDIQDDMYRRECPEV